MKKFLSILISFCIIFATSGICSTESFCCEEKSFYEEICQSQFFNYVDEETFKENNHIARVKDAEELNTYVFLNEDGTNTMYVLAENVKYKTED